MKNKVILLFLFTFVINNFWGNENDYHPLEIYSDMELIIKDNLKDFKITHINEIFPIGWSQDGKFAYIEFKEADGKPTIAYKLVIQNLITDRIIWESDYLDIYDLVSEHEINGEYEKLEAYNLEYETPEFFYQYKIDELEQVLVKNKIVQSKYTGFQSFPSLIENDTYDSKLLIIETRDESETYDDTIFFDYYSYNTEITKKDLGKKTIHSEELVNQEILGSQVIGFMKSPFENRIAVIVGIFRWSHHMGHNTSFKIIGCDLNYGFK